MTSSTEQTETIVNPTPMDTSTEIPAPNPEEKPSNVTEEEPSTNESKTGKRKRQTKKTAENEELNTSLSNGRPRRTLTKREDVSTAVTNGGTNKAAKAKAQSEEQEATGDDADDEQERDKNIPILHDVGDLAWVKMGGHPWWPSILIRDPNDTDNNFTKITGNARPKRLYFVSFYGSTADFAWVSDNAMITYKGVEAFTQYAQGVVDQATTKSQKEHFTERFQLKVTIGRREDWESAVREADAALKQTNDARLREIEPKLESYTKKNSTSNKSQQGRRARKASTKPEETSNQNDFSTLNAADRSLLAEKTFEFKSEDENENDSSMDLALRKPAAGKVQIPRVAINGNDSTSSPSTKRRNARQSEEASKTSVFGQNANGSSVSYQQRTSDTPETPPKNQTEKTTNGGESGRKRGRPSSKQTQPSSSSEESPAPTEFNSATPSVTMKFTTQRKPIIKPQAFSNSSANNNVDDNKHDIRTGFLSPSEEQEVVDALEQLRATKTFEEAEQIAKRRFEHILCLNLNRTHVDVPQEWFYTFLFTHPSLIMKNPQWFNENIDINPLEELDSKNGDQKSNSLLVLKNQLSVLSKLYRNELELQSSSPVKNRQSTTGKSNKRKGTEAQSSADEIANDSQGDELMN